MHLTKTHNEIGTSGVSDLDCEDTYASSFKSLTTHRGALHALRQRSRHVAGQQIARLPPALGQLSHISKLTDLRRSEFVDALDYQRRHVFPYLFPGTSAHDAWTRIFYWNETVFHICHPTTAVHMDLIERKVIRSSNPKALMHFCRAPRGLTDELQHDSADRSLMILAVGLLASHDLNEERMTSMSATLPLQFVPLVHPPQDLQVFLQLGYHDAHARAKRRIIDQIGDLDKLTIPGLGSIAAYLELSDSSELFQRTRYDNFWHAERFVDVTRGGLDLRQAPPATKSAGRGFFLNAQKGLTSSCLATLVQLSAVNEWLKSETVQETGVALDASQRILRLRNKLQHQLLSLPRWADLQANEQRLSQRHVYDCCRLAAAMYSNAVLMALPHHTGWHTKLANQLRNLINIDDWRDDPVMHSVLLWILVVGGIAAYRSDDIRGNAT